MKAFARLKIISDWFDLLSPNQMSLYVKNHPNSKYNKASQSGFISFWKGAIKALVDDNRLIDKEIAKFTNYIQSTDDPLKIKSLQDLIAKRKDQKQKNLHEIQQLQQNINTIRGK